jgi:hypothetical protein
MARGLVTSTIDLSGPFFTKDPAKTFRQNIRVLMAAVAAEGEADVRAQLQSGQSSRAPLRGITPNRVSGHVHGRVRSLSGRPWAVTAVTSVNASGLSGRQAVRLMAAGSLLEGRTHAFRRTTSRLRKAKAINKVELLKGLR